MEKNENRKYDFVITRVVTRNLLRDYLAVIKNIFGMRLSSYEDVINNNLNEMLDEMRYQYDTEPKILVWYRISVNPLTQGSIMITIYGEYL